MSETVTIPKATFEALVAACESMEAFIAVMHGRGPECKIPDKVLSPLNVSVRLDEIIKDARAALALAKDGAA